MLHITTGQWKHFVVNAEGLIAPDPGSFCKPAFSGGWKMLGLAHVRLNRFIPLADLEKELPGLTLQYPSTGNPQFTVVDNDHGTERRWGDGVLHLYFEKEEKR